MRHAVVGEEDADVGADVESPAAPLLPTLLPSSSAVSVANHAGASGASSTVSGGTAEAVQCVHTVEVVVEGGCGTALLC